MGSARGGLEEGRIDIGKVVDLENFASGLETVSCCSGSRLRVSYVGAELSETTVHRHTMGLELLAEQELTTSAVEAFIAQLGVA